MQLVVTGHYADGTLQDLTRASQFATNNAAIVTVEGSVAKPHQDGAAEIIVTVGGQETKLAVEVSAFGTPQPVSFNYETLAALSRHFDIGAGAEEWIRVIEGPSFRSYSKDPSREFSPQSRNPAVRLSRLQIALVGAKVPTWKRL